MTRQADILKVLVGAVADGESHKLLKTVSIQLAEDRSLRPPEVGEPQASWPAVSLTLLLCEKS